MFHMRHADRALELRQLPKASNQEQWGGARSRRSVGEGRCTRGDGRPFGMLSPLLSLYTTRKLCFFSLWFCAYLMPQGVRGSVCMGRVLYFNAYAFFLMCVCSLDHWVSAMAVRVCGLCGWERKLLAQRDSSFLSHPASHDTSPSNKNVLSLPFPLSSENRRCICLSHFASNIRAVALYCDLKLLLFNCINLFICTFYISD